MAATPETCFLVIAELTGYTAYLSTSELEHAPAIAGDLLETIVGRLEPPFRLTKFEGDVARDRIARSRARLARAIRADESIEDLGQVVTFTLDLEARWQVETGVRRVEIADNDVVLDVETTIGADPSVVWAHLTSPSLRTLWEGPLAIEETSPGGRRGVGTIAQWVTGRLATLEEIVDWQPYDHAGWRLAVAGLGPVDASADLEPAERGKRLRLGWAYLGGPPADEGALQLIWTAKEAAFARLRTVIAGSLPVVDTEEAQA